MNTNTSETNQIDTLKTSDRIITVVPTLNEIDINIDIFFSKFKVNMEYGFEAEQFSDFEFVVSRNLSNNLFCQKYMKFESTDSTTKRRVGKFKNETYKIDVKNILKENNYYKSDCKKIFNEKYDMNNNTYEYSDLDKNHLILKAHTINEFQNEYCLVYLEREKVFDGPNKKIVSRTSVLEIFNKESKEEIINFLAN
jgi:hypothetical protein